MFAMDSPQRILLVAAVGMAVGTLFATYVGRRARGWTFGLACGLGTLVTMAVLIAPLWLGILGIDLFGRR